MARIDYFYIDSFDSLANTFYFAAFFNKTSGKSTKNAEDTLSLTGNYKITRTL